MKLVVFGLTVSSSWGNGHATLWRGLIRALAERGVHVTFFERDQPFYALNRDLTHLPGGELALVSEWDEARARRALSEADAAVVTSYCADAQAACDAVAQSGVPSAFYDMDTPVTLARLAAGETVPYLPRDGLGGFDLVLSYTGGPALDALERRLGARRTAPLYGHADPAAHHRTAPDPRFACGLSYIGTYAADRQAAVDALFVAPARRRPDLRCVLAGSGYPADFPWTDNIWFLKHLAPPEHAGFYSSSALTLNVTRGGHGRHGLVPLRPPVRGRRAAAAPILSDWWDGPGRVLRPRPRTSLSPTRPRPALLAALDLGPDAELAARSPPGGPRPGARPPHQPPTAPDELLALLATIRVSERLAARMTA